MSVKELPKFGIGAYKHLSKTSLFLAFADLLAQEREGIPVDELSDEEIVSAVNERACALRTAGWSTHSGRDAPHRGGRR